MKKEIWMTEERFIELLKTIKQPDPHQHLYFIPESIWAETIGILARHKAEIERLQNSLDAAIAGQETLQKYFLSEGSPDGIRLKQNKETGEWEKFEPYMTIECPEEKDYEFLQTAIEKQTLKKPLKESLADYLCATCGSYINFDGLNGEIENAPKYCSECGQRLDWRQNDG